MGLVVLTIILVAACLFARYGLECEGRSIATTALIGAIVIGFITMSIWGVSYRDKHWVTCHVTEKDRGGDDGSYRVYTSDCNTLGNEDSMFQGKHNSSNVWQEIKPGHSYRFLIVGSRIAPVISQFKNILEVQPVK
jgi:hypothetical protein